MILNAYSLQSKYLLFFQSPPYLAPVSGILTITESCCKLNQYPMHRQNVTPTVRLEELPKVTLQPKVRLLQGERVLPSSVTSTALPAAVCQGRHLPGAPPGCWGGSASRQWDGKREWEEGATFARKGQPRHRPTTTIWVCRAPSWPGNLLPWKLIISEHLGRIWPLKTVHFIQRAHTHVCGYDSWLSSGLILQFPPYLFLPMDHSFLCSLPLCPGSQDQGLLSV